MAKAIRQWRVASQSTNCPPLRVVRHAVRTRIAPTPMASASGHLGTPGGPCDTGQTSALLGMEQLAPDFEALVVGGVVTESQVQSLLGQATHGRSVELVYTRAKTRCGGSLLEKKGATMAAAGAGKERRDRRDIE